MPALRIAGFLLCMVYAVGQESGSDALQTYRDELQQHPGNSLAHFRIGEWFFQQHEPQLAANEFRAALNGDPHPKWIDAWAHIDLGELLDSSKQRDRAVREYKRRSKRRTIQTVPWHLRSSGWKTAASITQFCTVSPEISQIRYRQWKYPLNTRWKESSLAWKERSI
jgi:tetratricopeptide (TPR) repeat protein